MAQQIDVDWAWSAFEGTVESPWGMRQAAHLFRRAGFGATWTELEQAVAAGPDHTVDQLLNSVESEPFLQQSTSLANAAIASGNVRQLSAWWCYRMLTTPAQLLEKATLFWHGHFATSADKVADAKLMLTQNELLRRHAFGDFGEMLLQVSRDPAMLIYLDSATNRKAHPNENYAREIMELFCLGEGNYTENDIRELARCFTGWEIRREKFRFNAYQHDTGTKTILGQTGPFGGEEAIRIVVGQPAAPEFLVARLIRYFLADELDSTAAEDLIRPLAEQLRSNGMVIRPVLKRLLSSNLFYSEHSVARKVRSPVELAVGLLRSLQGSTDMFELASQLEILGQGLFFPPGVKGWDGGRTWINSSTLLARSNLVRKLLQNQKTRFNREPLSVYLRSAGLSTSEMIVDYLGTLLFAIPLPSTARSKVVSILGSRPDSAENLTAGLHALFTLPEFQLS